MYVQAPTGPSIKASPPPLCPLLILALGWVWLPVAFRCEPSHWGQGHGTFTVSPPIEVEATAHCKLTVVTNVNPGLRSMPNLVPHADCWSCTKPGSSTRSGCDEMSLACPPANDRHLFAVLKTITRFNLSRGSQDLSSSFTRYFTQSMEQATTIQNVKLSILFKDHVCTTDFKRHRKPERGKYWPQNDKVLNLAYAISNQYRQNIRPRNFEATHSLSCSSFKLFISNLLSSKLNLFKMAIL